MNAADASLECARRLVATVPPLMQEIRFEMRGAAPEGLSVPQFRVLLFAGKYRGAGVSDLAAHLGVALPTASVAVDRLVRQGLLRAPSPRHDRRRRALELTPAGLQAVERAYDGAAQAFAQRLSTLTPDELGQLQSALALLERQLASTANAALPTPTLTTSS